MDRWPGRLRASLGRGAEHDAGDKENRTAEYGGDSLGLPGTAAMNQPVDPVLTNLNFSL